MNYSEFLDKFNENMEKCDWTEHPLFNPFTQFDREYYLVQKKDIQYKYRCFWALSKTLRPSHICELGTHAGSSADAYISATPTAKYTGIDTFPHGMIKDDNNNWSVYKPLDVCRRLFIARGFLNYNLIRIDLRSMNSLNLSADLVVVDACHDYLDAYDDMKLALTANPEFIFIDDYGGIDVQKAVTDFIDKELVGMVDFTHKIENCNQGFLIKIKGGRKSDPLLGLLN